MKKIIAAAVIAGAAALAAPAFAEPVLSLGYVMASEDISGTSIDVGVLRGTFGYNINSYFGVEAEAGFGIKEDSIGGQKFKIDNSFAGYVTARAPLNPNFDLTARLGYGKTKTSTSGPLGSASSNDSSVNYGVGAQYLFDGKNGVRAEYTKYDGDNNYDANAFSVSYVRKF